MDFHSLIIIYPNNRRFISLHVLWKFLCQHYLSYVMLPNVYEYRLASIWESILKTMRSKSTVSGDSFDSHYIQCFDTVNECDTYALDVKAVKQFLLYCSCHFHFQSTSLSEHVIRCSQIPWLLNLTFHLTASESTNE